MAKSGSELTPRQRRALEALLVCPDVKAAAQAAGVGYRTLRGWLKQPAFQQALQEAEQDALAALQRRLVALGLQAGAVLEEAMQPLEKTPYRLRAADLVLGNLLRLRELLGLEQRLSDLEARLGALEGEQHGHGEEA